MKDLLTRRNILIGAGGAVVVAGGAFEARRLAHNHAPSPYDDLLERLDDRDSGIEVGKAVLAEMPEFDAGSVAAKLRGRLEHATLAQIASEDEASGRLLEGHGWVLPEAIALLCALAAKAAA
jgi:hypothetical protein